MMGLRMGKDCLMPWHYLGMGLKNRMDWGFADKCKRKNYCITTKYHI